jgi:hypothetical protein
MSAPPRYIREPIVTAKRIIAAVLIALGLAAGAGAVTATAAHADTGTYYRT